MTGIQKADPAARRKAAWIIFTGLILAGAGVLAFVRHQPSLQRWLAANAEWLAGHAWVVFLAALVAVLPLVALAAYLFRVGTRIVGAARFPAPGYAVTRDTPVITGRAAVQRGRVVQILCVGLILCTLAIPVILWYIFVMVARAL